MFLQRWGTRQEYLPWPFLLNIVWGLASTVKPEEDIKDTNIGKEEVKFSLHREQNPESKVLLRPQSSLSLPGCLCPGPAPLIPAVAATYSWALPLNWNFKKEFLIALGLEKELGNSWVKASPADWYGSGEHGHQGHCAQT